MKKLLHQISNNKTGNRTMPVLFSLYLMLAPQLCGAQTAYITNYDDSTVSVINVATNTVINTIKVGYRPQAVSVSKDGNKVYVANYGASTISVINTASNDVSATIGVFGSPRGIAVSPDGSKLYVANGDTNTVSLINTADNTLRATITVGSNPWGLAISPDGTKVYVANSASNTVSIINTTTNAVSATISVGNYPYGVSVIPDGSKVFVADWGGHTVSVINTAVNIVSATIQVGAYPWGVSVSPDGNKVYIANSGDSTVSVIKTATNSVSDTITVGVAPVGVSVSPDGSKVFVANSGDSTVSVIQTATNAVTNTIKVGNSPNAFGNFITIYPDTCRANFSIAADTTQLHHYIVTNNTFGKQPIKYVWSWGDFSPDDTIPYPSHTYADSGFYTICLSITDSEACQSTFCDESFHALRTTNTMVYITVVNPLTTGTKEVNSLLTPDVVLYPNPATNQITIHISSFHTNEAVTVSIMNVLGQQTSPPIPLQVERGDALIDVSKFSEGIYFVQFVGGKERWVGKFIKSANAN